ncbi:hypothetical protein IHE56_00350 [Streptomyces sp. ID01-12c]|uniref:Uncharacterized protein n=1 Tax=Streptomyces caniscabiei TaxID=2746961 RepID=A0A927QIR8_9ACTN|nr:hypothetical protein [Streptomyces caniscabiei]MBD9700565.1 hypothetical protein [Streptomyces caniscabiei]MBD9727275.1 hypothetical protein [Streptomyces caniscabiei]MDX3512307.1 hypothetical protein [Streptomyces caniscabiei]MDX3721558.1 hypothetical protein [Streptomyces caniscabiei]MDX3727777.1 hypothetical protein [Streptomyces caniscabiei]
MPEHVSILQLLGGTALVLAAVIWVAVLVRVLRRDHEAHRARFAGLTRGGGRGLRGLPHQRRKGPHVEHVELTPAEQDAFAFLARQFSDDRLA